MKTLLVAQVIISGCMALAMTLFATLLDLGFSADLLLTWLTRFGMAWPVAFCLSIPIGKMAFMIAGKLAPAPHA